MGKIKFGLIPKLILGILLGIVVGLYLPLGVVRIFKTFSTFFGSFLSFFIPLMIIGFVVSGISKLANGAGKILGITVVIAYVSTLLAGSFSYTVANTFYGKLVSGINVENLKLSGDAVSPYFSIPLSPIFGVTSAIVLAFLLGISISYIKNTFKTEYLYNIFIEVEEVVKLVLRKIIIPLLPLHILGIFAEISYTGEVFSVINAFLKIYLFIFLIHFVYILLMFTIAGIVTKKNPFVYIKNQLPAYLTAIGTQSSAATIPINIESGMKNGVKKEIVEFVVPICATIHLAGSMITLTSCIVGILIMFNMPHTFAIMLPFIAMLGIAMVAAPGAPGGAVMSALPFLYMIGIDSSGAMASLLIALYITQDSFGTAINVSGDNAIAIYVNEIYKKLKF